ncbi:MAG: UDP-N-acetylglucosamine 1-carboxyvinyltransferase [candidate division WOR-3 bacterium]|nr:MAG: UDP-N-acetylglucosamine 1-carboxyvinyltransferase [candidate division WOR-3 bacterium]
MDRFVVSGGTRLQGDVAVASSKNAVLPILAACLLTDQECVVSGVPLLEDVATMLRLLESMGVEVTRRGGTVRVRASARLETEAPYDIVRKMRASYYVLGPLLGRMGAARVSLPGGCAIGTRPVDLTLRGIEALGTRVRLEHGYVDAAAPSLRGARVLLEGARGPSVGATINTMMAAALAQGETVIAGAACEPEVADVAGFLNRMGATVDGAGTAEVLIKGVGRLGGAEYHPIPDRIETGTLAVAAAITKGRVRLTNCRPDHLEGFVDRLRETGAEVETTRTTMTVSAKSRARPADISTAPYPGFPTDLQAQFMALVCTAEGASTVTENIFPSRFMHAMELDRMGAKVEVNGNVAVVRGVDRLSGAQVMASDLRASAALVLAALVAEGKTEILRIYHLDRGYERLEQKLNALGAKIERVPH